jgi:hypothetical protein
MLILAPKDSKLASYEVRDVSFALNVSRTQRFAAKRSLCKYRVIGETALLLNAKTKGIATNDIFITGREKQGVHS